MLDLTQVLQGMKDTSGPTGGDLGNGFSIVGKRPANGRTGSVSDPGQLVMNPAAATLATSPATQAAGMDPNTDSFSPTLIALKSTPDGQMLLTQYANDPVFQHVIDLDAHRAAGQTQDAATGEWSQEPQAVAAYNGFHANAQTELSRAASPEYNAPILTGRDEWQRDTTKTLTVGALSGMTAPGFGDSSSSSFGKLPADALRDQNETRFSAMTNVLIPNTNKFVPPKDGPGGIVITKPTSLVLPNVNPQVNFVNTPGGVVNTPKPLPTPDTTQKVAPYDPFHGQYGSGGPTYRPGGY